LQLIRRCKASFASAALPTFPRSVLQWSTVVTMHWPRLSNGPVWSAYLGLPTNIVSQAIEKPPEIRGAFLAIVFNEV